MLSLPDFREKQILFIQQEKDAHYKIVFFNDNIRLMKNDEAVNQVSVHKVLAIFVIGHTSMTSQILQKCAEHGISLFFLKPNFQLYATLSGPFSGNFELRAAQYAATTERELMQAQALVSNKADNQRALLVQREIPPPDILQDVRIDKSVKSATDFKALLGVEGSITKVYFQTLFEENQWYKRMPRTKVDINNVLMDIGYTFLFNFVDSITQLFGFDAYKGVYHKLFFQRKSLVCDLIEPMRPLIDRQIIKSYNLRQIDPKDFKKKDHQYLLGYKEQAKYTQLFLNALMERKEDIYLFIREYYYFIMNGKDEMPTFKL
jgi:CRISPR-associated protein Cas1